MRALRAVLIFFSFFFIIFASWPVYANEGRMITEEMPKDEQESVIEGACINVFDTEPEKRKILCFDVNESGLIALGTETENNKSICVYTENMVFLYRINFICNGAFSFEWHGDDIEIYFVRSHDAIIVDSDGNIKSVRSYTDDIENNDYFNNVLEVTERNINGKKYSLKNYSVSFTILEPNSFPILSVTKPGEEEEILYDVSDEYFVTDTLQSIFDIFVVAFALTLLSVSVVKFIKKTRKTKKKKNEIGNKYLCSQMKTSKIKNKIVILFFR